MMFCHFYAVFLLLLLLEKDCFGTGTLSLKLLRYENPSHKLSTGVCCDNSCLPCDNYFKLCLSRFGASDCSIGSLWTDEEGGDSFTFGSLIYQSMDKFESVGNPLLYSFNSWNDTFNMKIDVYDNDRSVDSFNHHLNDYVETLSLNVSYKASLNQASSLVESITLQGKPRGVQSGPKLSMQVTVYCNNNYMLPSCEEYCVDTDDATGHYKCNYTSGSRECLTGWHGSKCDLKVPFCVPRNDSFGHYNCHENGTKLCLIGWENPEKNCTEASKHTESSSNLLRSITSISNTLISRSLTQSSTRSTSYTMPTTNILHIHSSNTAVLKPETSTTSAMILSNRIESAFVATAITKQESVYSLVQSQGTSKIIDENSLKRLSSMTSSLHTEIGSKSALHYLNAHTNLALSPSHLITTNTSLAVSESLLSPPTSDSLYSQSIFRRPTIKSAKVRSRNEGLLWLILLAVPAIFFTFAIVYLHQTNHCKRISRVHSEIGQTNSHRLKRINVKPSTTTTIKTEIAKLT